MNLGQLYNFEYAGEKRSVIFIEEDKKQVAAITLKIRPRPKAKLVPLPKNVEDAIMAVVNSKIFTDFSSNKELINQALSSQKEIGERALVKMLMTGSMSKLGSSDTLKIMELLVRRYDKKKIKDYK